MTESFDTTVMGKITSVYGVKGWVKVFSYTRPKDNICKYSAWTIQKGKTVKQVKVLNCKTHGNGIVAQLEGCNDREQAKDLAEYLVSVPTAELPDLPDGDFYWHQLEGLLVRTVEGSLLGKVSHLIETGSNDVFVVKPCDGSIDGKERLIPYLLEQVVKAIDLDDQSVSVDWDPEF
jgi:16S rRNA processing protein RimM